MKLISPELSVKAIKVNIKEMEEKFNMAGEGFENINPIDRNILFKAALDRCKDFHVKNNLAEVFKFNETYVDIMSLLGKVLISVDAENSKLNVSDRLNPEELINKASKAFIGLLNDTTMFGPAGSIDAIDFVIQIYGTTDADPISFIRLGLNKNLRPGARSNYAIKQKVWEFWIMFLAGT